VKIRLNVLRSSALEPELALFPQPQRAAAAFPKLSATGMKLREKTAKQAATQNVLKTPIA
jgi:hypothetical protein